MSRYSLKFVPNATAINCEKTKAYCKYLNLDLKDKCCNFAVDKEDLDCSKRLAEMLLKESPILMQANIDLVIQKSE